MFESVKQDGAIHPMVYVTSLLVSLAAHAVILCVLIIAPLVFFSMIQAEELITFLYAPPTPPVPIPPPAPPQGSRTASQRPVPINIDFRAPDKMPVGIPPAPDTEGVFYPDTVTAIPGVKGGGFVEGVGTPVLITTAEPPVLEPPLPPKKQPSVIRVGRLEPSKLIYKVNPAYPDLARRARVSGDVVLEALIDEEGSVAAIKVLGGHPLLVKAAEDAVRQWKYSPTIMNGEPVQILAAVTVVFRLNK